MTLEAALHELKRRGLASVQGPGIVLIIDACEPNWTITRTALASGPTIEEAVNQFLGGKE